MKANRTLVSCWTSLDRDFCEDQLKLCFIWYDEILVEPILKDSIDPFINRLLGEERPDKRTAYALTDVLKPLDPRHGRIVSEALGHYYPRWGENQQNCTYPEPACAEEHAHNVVLAQLAVDHGVTRIPGGAVESAEGQARSAVAAAALWRNVNTILPCMLQAASYEKVAMEALATFNSMAQPADVAATVLQISVPSLRRVSWKDVVHLRQSRHLASLRAQIGRVAAATGDDLESAITMFRALEKDAMDEVLEFAEPKFSGVAIESLATLMPSKIATARGALKAGRDTLVANQREADVGWFYMLREIQRVAKSGASWR